jgi:GDP-4-dehydro-6-deoxy-D-mannose reductase
VRVLVVGGSGFVGAHLVRACADAGDEVYATSRSRDRAARLDRRAHPLELDVHDPGSIFEAVSAASPDRVFHLAGQANPKRSLEEEESVLTTNILGTLHLLQAVKAGAPGARVLYVGSSEEYGRVPPERQPIREDAALMPVSPYGVSRAAASLVAQRFALAEGLFVVRTRSFNHTGAGQSTEYVTADFADQLVRARRRGERAVEVMTGDVSVRRDFSGVTAVVQAYRALLEKGTSGEVYNVCSGEPLLLRDLLAELARIAGVEATPRLDAARGRPTHPVLTGDPARLEATTGLSLRSSVRRDLEALVREREKTLTG